MKHVRETLSTKSVVILKSLSLLTATKWVEGLRIHTSDVTIFT